MVSQVTRLGMEVGMRSDEILTALLGMRGDKSLAEVLTDLEDAAAGPL